MALLDEYNICVPSAPRAKLKSMNLTFVEWSPNKTAGWRVNIFSSSFV